MDLTASASASSAAAPMRAAVHTRPTPKGLVRTRASPARPVLFCRMRSGWITPVTDRPYLTSLSAIECPPASEPPASMTFSLPPCRMRPRMLRSICSGKQTMLSAVLTVPPMAYTSLRALAAAIWPNT